jgi:predicted nucleotidyltransferase
MIDEIRKELKNLEEKYHIKILYAVESGSRAWGFASTNSDWDVRFIYVHQYDWYLSVDDKKDNIEIILPSDIDLAGWELKKALLLFKKSNPPLLEWLSSPIVYKEAFSLAEQLRTSSKEYFNPKSCLYHYLNMASRNWTEYFKTDLVRVKKYFYVLRPLMACSWIESTGTMAPMEFHHLLAAEMLSDEARNDIKVLLERKMQGEELDKGSRLPAIDAFIEDRIAHFRKVLEEFVFSNQPTNSELNIIFRNTLEEVWAHSPISK